MTKRDIAHALLVSAIVLGALTPACRDATGPRAIEASPTDASGADAPPGMPAVDPPDGNFAGEVREHHDAGSYTYLLVTTDDGGREWVVTLGEGAPVGSQVDIVNMGVRSDFRSRRLARTFDRLVFAIVRRRG